MLSCKRHLSHLILSGSELIVKDFPFQMRYQWWPQRLLCCCWLLLSLSSLSCPGLCKSTHAVTSDSIHPVLFQNLELNFILLLCRYKWYFFPPISSPRGSRVGQWLMDPNHQVICCLQESLVFLKLGCSCCFVVCRPVKGIDLLSLW